jgi:hypothetical protein
VRCSVIDLRADQKTKPLSTLHGVVFVILRLRFAGPPARICRDCVPIRNTLRQAVSDMDGMSKPKKENFLSKLCNQIA